MMRVLHLPGPELSLQPRVGQTEKQSGPDFTQAIKSAIAELDHNIKGADRASESAARGEIDIHQAAMAINKADLQLRLTVKVRNKVLNAYQEMMRLSV